MGINLDAVDFKRLPLKGLLELLEARLIRQALDKADGVVAQAAELLGLRRTTLVEKIRKLGIERPPIAAADVAVDRAELAVAASEV
jgi:sigma-54 specific flagellar transcriptional regulator A